MHYRILFLLLIFVSQPSIAASFNCNKASAPIEHAICDNADLDAADSLLSQRYNALRKSLSNSEVKTLKQEQRQWLKQRLKQCAIDNITCLVNVYQSRIADFDSRLGMNSVSGLSAQTASRHINDFVPAGYKILDMAEGDLNRDQYNDVVLILAQDNEQGEALRPLLILIRDANSQLHLAARNDHVVLCVECGGMLGDPYQRTAIKNGYFTVEHHGGSSWRWTKYITFKYVPKKSNWYIHKVSNQSYHSAEPDNIEESIQTAKQLGYVSFKDYQNEW
ncbi:lysozyme inhibitor LprI family protein [Candidatus Albibeggiatoa sp. nov. NOAA]|uniref:lysozyme inhibitor LprI family protein n=1 Tax=Candidatus Albibeggiatoa sp. nov. NOAA TaxID=3162724 RepID=UPI0032F82106|nr:lysozyme inhibitor LprI family protein [Thiotrichaceae bacterium]